jgi:hypothetical protein
MSMRGQRGFLLMQTPYSQLGEAPGKGEWHVAPVKLPGLRRMASSS